MNFLIDVGWILGGFWDHFGSQNGIQKSMKFRMRFRRPKQGGPWFFGVGPAECAGSLGGIIGGYKDAKIAGETRTRALGIPGLCLARPWWGGGPLRAFRRAALYWRGRWVELFANCLGFHFEWLRWCVVVFLNIWSNWHCVAHRELWVLEIKK